MGNLIVKDNALIEASHKLSEVEQRIILLAILRAREQGDKIENIKDKKLSIAVQDYIDVFGADRTTAYRNLKKAVMSLFQAEWGYRYINEKGNKAVRYERFVQSVEYVDNESVVSLVFATAIIPMLVELERNFTSYEIGQVANLSSRYAMRLYEFCLRFLNKKTRKGWLDITVDELRWRFGLLPSDYTRLDNFKRKVLDYSIQEINQHTDIIITYKQKKQRQKIVGFTFEFERKYTPDDAEKDKKKIAKLKAKLDNLTDAEREVVASATAYADEHCKTEQHKNNLIAKALREHREQEVELQAQQKAEQEAKEQKKALKHAQTLEKERQVQLHQKAAELRLQAITEQFETLNDDEQRLVLDSVEQSLPKLFVSAFKQAREQGTAHKDKQFMKPFDDIMTLYLQSKH